MAEVRFFFLENCFPKIEQSVFDGVDFSLHLLTSSCASVGGYRSECALVYSFSFASLNHNLVGFFVDVRNVELVSERRRGVEESH